MWFLNAVGRLLLPKIRNFYGCSDVATWMLKCTSTLIFRMLREHHRKWTDLIEKRRTGIQHSGCTALVAPVSSTPCGSRFSRLGLRNTTAPCCSIDAVAEIYMACRCALADPKQMPSVSGDIWCVFLGLAARKHILCLILG